MYCFYLSVASLIEKAPPDKSYTRPFRFLLLIKIPDRFLRYFENLSGNLSSG